MNEMPAAMEIDGDHATVSFERRYPRPRSAVWHALTQPAQLAQWLDAADVDLRVGGRFDVHFSDNEMHGVIEELVPEQVLAYSWHEGRDDTSHVRWELTDDGDGTLMRLVHTKLMRDPATGFAAGWHHHLEQLESLLGGQQTDWNDARFAELRASYQAALS